MKRSTFFLLIIILIQAGFFYDSYQSNLVRSMDKAAGEKMIYFEQANPNDLIIISKNDTSIIHYYKVLGKTQKKDEIAVKFGYSNHELLEALGGKINGFDDRLRGIDFEATFINKSEYFVDSVSILKRHQFGDTQKHRIHCLHMSKIWRGEIPYGLGPLFYSPFYRLFNWLIYAIAFGIIFFVIKIINGFLPSKAHHILPIFIIIRASYFFSILTDHLYENSLLIQWIMPLIAPVATYFIFLQVRKKILKLGFFEQEFYKLITIVFSGTLLALSVTFISNYLYQKGGNLQGFSPATLLSYGNFLFSFHFWVNIAMANFFVNLFRYFLKLRSRAQKVDKSKSEQRYSEAELASLSARVNPHFLYNSLNSIASLASTNSDKTEQMAIALADFYRYSTNRKDEFMVSISEEIETIKAYLYIEKIRFDDLLKYEIEVDDKTEQIKIPRFTLQPLVENAIKYGYNPTKKRIEISIHLDLEEDQILSIRIYDNGPPFEDDISSGYGLSSIRKKLESSFKENYNITFQNQPDKYVQIKIKLS